MQYRCIPIATGKMVILRAEPEISIYRLVRSGYIAFLDCFGIGVFLLEFFCVFFFL